MTNPIAALFGRSPIRPIQEHMAKSHECVVLLGDFVNACINNDWENAEVAYQSIRDTENAADEIKRDVRSHLPKSLFLPVARSDLLNLLRAQDRVADLAKETAVLMMGRKMRIPEQLSEMFRLHYLNALNTSAQALKAINELDELLETGFRGKEARMVEGLIADLEKFESKSDSSQLELRTKLFEMEDTLAPVDVMFLYKAIDLVEDIANMANKMGGNLMLLVAQ